VRRRKHQYTYSIPPLPPSRPHPLFTHPVSPYLHAEAPLSLSVQRTRFAGQHEPQQALREGDK